MIGNPGKIKDTTKLPKEYEHVQIEVCESGAVTPGASKMAFGFNPMFSQKAKMRKNKK
jgi:hypothetical protein